MIRFNAKFMAVIGSAMFAAACANSPTTIGGDLNIAIHHVNSGNGQDAQIECGYYEDGAFDDATQLLEASEGQTAAVSGETYTFSSVNDGVYQVSCVAKGDGWKIESDTKYDVAIVNGRNTNLTFVAEYVGGDGQASEFVTVNVKTVDKFGNPLSDITATVVNMDNPQASCATTEAGTCTLQVPVGLDPRVVFTSDGYGTDEATIDLKEGDFSYNLNQILTPVEAAGTLVWTSGFHLKVGEVRNLSTGLPAIEMWNDEGEVVAADNVSCTSTDNSVATVANCGDTNRVITGAGIGCAYFTLTRPNSTTVQVTVRVTEDGNPSNPSECAPPSGPSAAPGFFF